MDNKFNSKNAVDAINSDRFNYRKIIASEIGSQDPNKIMHPGAMPLFENDDEAYQYLLSEIKNDKLRRENKKQEIQTKIEKGEATVLQPSPGMYPINFREEPRDIKVALDPRISSTSYDDHFHDYNSEFDPDDYEHQQGIDDRFIGDYARESDGFGDDDSLEQMLRTESCEYCKGRGCDSCKIPEETSEDSTHELHGFHEDEDEGATDDDNESIDEDKVVCPSCDGMSRINKLEKHVYNDTHCSGCKTKDCGSDKSNRAPHCRGCGNVEGCEGRSRQEWTNKDKDGNLVNVCKTCGNEGEVTPNVAYSIERNDESTEDETSGAPKGKGSVQPKEITVKHDTNAEDFSDPILPDDENNPAVSSAMDKLKSLKKIKKPSKSSRPSTAFSNLFESRSLERNLDDSESEEVPKVEEPSISAKKHPKDCILCKGTGILPDDEIAKVNKSDEYKEGIAEIRRSTPDKTEAREKLNDFMEDQYACKGMTDVGR